MLSKCAKTGLAFYRHALSCGTILFYLFSLYRLRFYLLNDYLSSLSLILFYYPFKIENSYYYDISEMQMLFWYSGFILVVNSFTEYPSQCFQGFWRCRFWIIKNALFCVSPYPYLVSIKEDWQCRNKIIWMNSSPGFYAITGTKEASRCLLCHDASVVRLLPGANRSGEIYSFCILLSHEAYAKLSGKIRLEPFAPESVLTEKLCQRGCGHVPKRQNH